jgi:hypothetical protein
MLASLSFGRGFDAREVVMLSARATIVVICLAKARTRACRYETIHSEQDEEIAEEKKVV